MANITAIAAHIRRCLKNEGIPARVRVSPAGGAVQVITKGYNAHWTPEQLRAIGHIALCNRMTLIRGQEIDLSIMEQLTGANQFDFYPTAETLAYA